MSTIMKTAAVVVIATCGYFVYEDRQEKKLALEKAEASEQGQKYRRCRDQLRGVVDFTGSTSGDTMEEISSRLILLVSKSQSESVANMLVSLFEDQWEKCGPI